jgi:putative ABC transport system permease protein
MLGLAGGVLGYVVGAVAAAILGPYFAGLDVVPVLAYFWWSIGVATVIALAGSWYPMFRAARIDPAVIMQEI